MLIKSRNALTKYPFTTWQFPCKQEVSLPKSYPEHRNDQVMCPFTVFKGTYELIGFGLVRLGLVWDSVVWCWGGGGAGGPGKEVGVAM